MVWSGRRALPGAGGEDAGAVLVWLLPLGITLMSGWQGKGNTGVKYRFQCLGSNFYKHPFLCVGPDLIPEVSQPRARFLAWKAQTVLVWHWPKSREGRSENQLPTPGPSLPSKKSLHEATLGGRGVLPQILHLHVLPEVQPLKLWWALKYWQNYLSEWMENHVWIFWGGRATLHYI